MVNATTIFSTLFLIIHHLENVKSPRIRMGKYNVQ